jgi:hypothetical protein
MAEFDFKAYLKETAPAPEQPQPSQPAGFDFRGYLRGANAPVAEPMPGPRREYELTEVPGAALRNLPGSAKQFATGLYEAVTNPLQTLTAVADVAAGGLKMALPKAVTDFIDRFDTDPQATQRAVDTAKAFGGLMADRYGSYEAIKRTVAEDPVGAAGDLSTLLSAGRVPVGAAATGARLAGAANAAQRLTSASEALRTAATVTNPLSVVSEPARMGLEAYRAGSPSALTLAQQRNAPRDQTLREARALGYVVPPGTVDPVSGRFVLAEQIAGKTRLEQDMVVRNQEVTNQAARNALNLPETAPLTADAMQQIRREEFNRGYRPVQQFGTLQLDNDYFNDLARIEQNFSGPSGSFPAAVPPTVQNIVYQNIPPNFQFTTADALQNIQRLRDEAAASFRRGDNGEGLAQRGIANALENQIERGIAASGAPNAADLLNQFRESRRRMSIAHTVEDAIREGSGNVSAPYLARQLQAGEPLTGDLLVAARFANTFPRVAGMAQQVGTPSSGAVMGLSGTLGAATGALTGGLVGAPTLGAAVGSLVGTALPPVVSSATRAYLRSGMGQRAAVPQYDPFAERLVDQIQNALLLQQGERAREQRNMLMGVQ